MQRRMANEMQANETGPVLYSFRRCRYKTRRSAAVVEWQNLMA